MPLCGSVLRGAAFVAKDEVKAKANRVGEITGLELSEYFSAAKSPGLLTMFLRF